MQDMMSKGYCEKHGRGFLLSEGCTYCNTIAAERTVKSPAQPEMSQFILPRDAPLGATVRIDNDSGKPMRVVVEDSPDDAVFAAYASYGSLPILRAAPGSCALAVRVNRNVGHKIVLCWVLQGELVAQ